VEKIVKTSKESYTETAHIVTLADMNGYNRLFGGKLMEWIDICAGVTARRHSNRNVTTVSVQGLEFREPAWANNVVVLAGQVVWTGRTSMVVRVESSVEKMDGSRLQINLAYLTMVALDENGHPTPVPKLEISTDEERAEWEKVEKWRAK